MSKLKRAKKPTATITRRVQFVYDEDARFEECNGEARPLTEEEYAQNQYLGCPDHPRSRVAPKTDPKTGKGICGPCGKEYEPIPYAEYLAYYGNPDRHVYLGCIVQAQCESCQGWQTAAGLWGIDFMDDHREYLAIPIDHWMSEADARALPGYAGEVARELLEEADGASGSGKGDASAARTATQRTLQDKARRLDRIRAELWDTRRKDWRELQSCADAIQEICLILDAPGDGQKG